MRQSAHRTSDWLTLGTLFCIIFSLLVLGTGTNRARASGSRHAERVLPKARTADSARCRHRNRAAGTVTLGMTNERGDPNFALNAAFPMAQDDMFRHDNRGRFVPMIATEVPTIANGGIKNGGRIIIIHLKRGLHWSDGAEITSSDVRFAWRVLDDPAFDPANNCGDLCTAIVGVTTPDRYTAVMRLTHVDPQWLNETEGNGGFVVPGTWPGFWNNNPHAAALKYLDPSFVGPNVPTNGPYQVESFDNTKAILRPMPYYTGMTCGGFLQRIILRVYRSSAALLAAATSRNVDILPGAHLELLPQLRTAARTHAFRLHIDPSFSYEHVELNHDRTFRGQVNPLYDVRVRLAIALAVDKVSLAQRALGINRRWAQGIEAWTPWVNTPKVVESYADTKITGQWDPIVGRYVTDAGGNRALADARRLLAQTPWKHGATLDFTTSDLPFRRSEEATVAKDLARIGVRLTAHFVPQTTFLADYDHGGILSRGAFQVVVVATGGSNDPFGLSATFVSRFIPRDTPEHIGQNNSGIRDPIIDRAYELAGSTFRQKIQQTSYGVIQTEINRKAHLIPLYFRPLAWTDDGRIVNLGMNADGNFYWNASAWTLKASG